MADKDDILTEKDLVAKDPTEEDDNLDVDIEDEVAFDSDDDRDQKVDYAAKLAELEKSNKGLIKSLTQQRGIKQELQQQLNDIKAAVDEFKTSKQTGDQQIITDSKGNKIPVQFDDDGNPFLDPSQITSIQNQEVKALKTEINNLKTATSSMVSKNSEQDAINSLLDEKEGYPVAHKTVTKAWNFLKDDLFDAYLMENGIKAPATADQAIEIAMNAESLQKQFSEKFPNLDMESVLEAHLIATPRYMRKALDKALPQTSDTSQSLDFDRPTSLASANTSGGDNQESLLSRVADMPMEEFLNLDEQTMGKIDKLLQAKG